MTPGARLAAAAGVLDRVLAGEAAEAALVRWGRASRYAGSGDRGAVRDLVFDALRRRASAAALGGGMTGAGLVAGLMRGRGEDPRPLMTGQGHDLPPPGPGRPPTQEEALDLPPWIAARFAEALGSRAAPVAAALRERAPVFLRVNLARIGRAEAQVLLAAEGVEARPHALAASALEVTAGARRIAQGRAYAEGLVELQDAASQAVVEALPLRAGMRVLDLCAGGGGKTLAMAARAPVRLWAHDAAPARMADLPVRAARAGVRVTLTARPEEAGPFDLVLADVPCSGSGSWRRDPEGKWRLTPARLADLVALQAEVLARALRLVAPGGVVGYATCSLLAEENEGQVAAAQARTPGLRKLGGLATTPLEGGDGFFLAILARDTDSREADGAGVRR
jgi:16S rRNA (cytosine967-C5)-methyltransferase